MRILHTADWHLGRVLHERSLLEDQRHVLGQLVALLRARPHDALIVAGDVFDRGVPPEEAVELLTSFLGELRAACPALAVILIAGNHDSGPRLAFGAPLLAATGVHVRGGAEGLEEPVVVRGADGTVAEVWPVPFLWPGSLAPATVEGEEGGAARPATQAAALEEALRRVRARRSEERIQILAAHCYASGGEASDSERTLVGHATRVEAGLFAGFDYVALGHLHRPQPVGFGAWYAGSPLPYSFSEVHDRKCVLSVDLPGRRARATVTQVPIAPLRQMAVVRGRFDRLRLDPEYAVHADKYLRVELEAPEVLLQPVAALRQRFPYLLDFYNPLDGPREPVLGSGEAGAARLGRERADLELDFVDFEREVRGGEAPPDGVLEAFRSLRARAEGPEGSARTPSPLPTPALAAVPVPPAAVEAAAPPLPVALEAPSVPAPPLEGAATAAEAMPALVLAPADPPATRRPRRGTGGKVAPKSEGPP